MGEKMINEMSQGDARYTKRFVLIPLLFVIYAIYYDQTILKFPISISYILAKAFFIVFPFIIYCTNIFKEESRAFILGLFWITYCSYHVYFVSIVYNTAFAQVAVAFSVMATFPKKEYIIFAILMLIASSYSILFSQNDFSYVIPGFSSRTDVFINNICLQALCYLVYYYVTLPKLRLTMQEKKMAEYGKASSFILHEMAKPLSRLKQDSSNVEVEISKIQDVYQISRMINDMVASDLPKSSVKVDEIFLEALRVYEEFIKHGGINIKMHIKNVEQHTNAKYLALIFDNLLKNAIEEVQNHTIKEIEIVLNDKCFLISNKIESKIIDSTFFGNPMNTSKEGHMGVGLFIGKTLAEKMSYRLDFKISRDVFIAEIFF